MMMHYKVCVYFEMYSWDNMASEVQMCIQSCPFLEDTDTTYNVLQQWWCHILHVEKWRGGSIEVIMTTISQLPLLQLSQPRPMPSATGSTVSSAPTDPHDWPQMAHDLFLPMTTKGETFQIKALNLALKCSRQEPFKPAIKVYMLDRHRIAGKQNRSSGNG